MISSRGEKTFYFINYFLLLIIGFITLYPFYYVLIASISSGKAVAEGAVFFLPKNITFDAYIELFKSEEVWKGYGNSIYYTVFGTIISMFLTICGAYPLSKEYFKGRRVLRFLMVFTMWFQAGMIPTYLNFISLNMRNEWGILIGISVSTFNVILLINFFSSVPKSLEEAATIDGANDLQVLFHIFVPLSKPALATIALFYGVNRWNGYFWSMILLRDEDKYPLNVWLKSWIVENHALTETGSTITSTYSADTFVYATIMVAIIPIMLIYPFIQRFFVSGVMVGAVKG